MKTLFAIISAAWSAIFKKVTSSDISVKLPTDLQITPAEIDECIKAVNIIKAVVNNPVTILVTDLTPISMDNIVRLDISNALPGILAGLTYAKNLAAGIPEDNNKINALLANVRLANDVDKNALYHALLARLIMVAAKGKVSWSDAVSIIEVYFKQVFNIASPAPVPIPPIESAPAPAPVLTTPAPAPVVSAQDPAPVAVSATPTPAAVELPPLTAEQIAAVVANAAISTVTNNSL
jgi:hypothetical protein